MKNFQSIKISALILWAGSFAMGAVSNINDVNLTNYTTKNVVGVFTNYTPKTYPIEQSYGADTFWSKWDIRRQADGTVAFHVGGYYIAVSNGVVTTSTSVTDESRFSLELDRETYYIRAWTGEYLACRNDGFSALRLDETRSDDARWYFFKPTNPTSGNHYDLNIYNHEVQNIIGIFTNYIPKTYPYTDTYGPFTFWGRFDLIHDANGGVQFKVGGYHLNVNGDDLGASNSGSYFWTLEASASGAYYIKDDTGRYLTGAGTGYKKVFLADAATDDALWYFMNPIEAVTDLGLPHAVAAEDHSHALENDVVGLDGSGSTDSDSNTALATYAWSVFSAPSGSVADVADSTAAVTSIIPDMPGAYVFALTVTDEDGWSNTTHQNLTVHEGVHYETSATQVDENSQIYTWTPFQTAPLVFANMQGFGGSDPAGVRIWGASTSGFTAMIEEETSLDEEIGHNNETLGILALPSGDLVDETGAVIGEAGSFNHTQSGTGFSTLSFANSYNNPVVIMMMNTYNGTNPAHMRLDQLDDNSVAYKIEEWAYLDATHNQETIAYLVVEMGAHTLLDGSLLQAQRVTSDHDWVDLDFAIAYNANPVVLSMSQTQNGADPIVTRHDNLSVASMSLRVQEEEAKDGSHNVEVVGVISIGN